MFLKILLSVLIVIAALTALRVFGRASSTRIDRAEQAARESVRRRMKGEDLMPCPNCGAYVSAHETCHCQDESSRKDPDRIRN